MKIGPSEMDIIIYDKFLRNVVIDKNGCWLFAGILRKGYGQLNYGRKQFKKSAHRYTYELFKGAIPTGLVIDHKCRVKNCCNPEHLECVSQSENINRGLARQKILEIPIELKRSRMAIARERAAEINRAKTHCPRGHEYTESNTRIQKLRGSQVRSCRECHRQRKRRPLAEILARSA